MSDSILYLAIVAIWAGFLIPAWLRRPHAARDAAVEVEPEPAEFTADTDVPLHRSGGDVASAASTAHRIPGGTEYGDDVHTHDYGPAGSGPGDSSRYGPPAYETAGSGGSQSRVQMMRARRRMLAILTALVFITAGFFVTGYVQWWICVPPAAMLLLYVLLLREIAMADAELARKRAAWEAREAGAAQSSRDVWRRAHEVWQAEAEADAPAEPSTEPTAKIIDISGRVGDQLYDQYADAAARAVGD